MLSPPARALRPYAPSPCLCQRQDAQDGLFHHGGGPRQRGPRQGQTPWRRSRPAAWRPAAPRGRDARAALLPSGRFFQCGAAQLGAALLGSRRPSAAAAADPARSTPAPGPPLPPAPRRRHDAFENQGDRVYAAHPLSTPQTSRHATHVHPVVLRARRPSTYARPWGRCCAGAARQAPAPSWAAPFSPRAQSGFTHPSLPRLSTAARCARRRAAGPARRPAPPGAATPPPRVPLRRGRKPGLAAPCALAIAHPWRGAPPGARALRCLGAALSLRSRRAPCHAARPGGAAAHPCRRCSTALLRACRSAIALSAPARLASTPRPANPACNPFRASQRRPHSGDPCRQRAAHGVGRRSPLGAGAAPHPPGVPRRPPAPPKARGPQPAGCI
jgi:hypothetical protein